MLEGHAFVGDVQPLFVGYEFLLYGCLGNAIDIGQALVGETQADQHAELIVLLLKLGIGRSPSYRRGWGVLLPLKGVGGLYFTFFCPFSM